MDADEGDRPEPETVRDKGEALATIPLHNGDEIRFCWITAAGEPFLSLYIWYRGKWERDRWFRGNRGFRVHPREVKVWLSHLARSARERGDGRAWLAGSECPSPRGVCNRIGSAGFPPVGMKRV